MNGSSGTPKQFGGAVGERARQNSGQSNSQSGDVRQGIEVGGTGAVADPKAFLAGGLKAGIVAFTFCTQGISPLELEALPVNGKAVVGGQRDIFGASPAFFAIVPVFVAARANAGFGLAEGAAEFLAGSAIVKSFPVLVHGQTSGTKEPAGRQFIGVLCIAFVQWDNGFSLVNILHQIVDRFHVIALVAQEGTLLNG